MYWQEYWANIDNSRKRTNFNNKKIYETTILFINSKIIIIVTRKHSFNRINNNENKGLFQKYLARMEEHLQWVSTISKTFAPSRMNYCKLNKFHAVHRCWNHIFVWCVISCYQNLEVSSAQENSVHYNGTKLTINLLTAFFGYLNFEQAKNRGLNFYGTKSWRITYY